MRPRFVLTLRRVLSVAAVSLTLLPATSACFEDPPPPTKCPPAEPPAPSCEQQLDSLAMPACPAPPVAACMRPSCECASTECLPDPAACYPPGDCPPAVSAGGSAPTCLSVSANAVNTTCQCGCGRCIAACDGKGVAFAAFVPPPPNDPPLFHVELGTSLPKRGRLGVYLRIRGIQSGPIALAMLHGNAVVAAFPFGIGSPVYTDVVIGGPASPAWESADGAPTAIELRAPGARVAIEIDCIVPFVVAP